MSNPQFVFHRYCFSLPGKTSEWHILSSTKRCTHGLSRNRSHCFYCCVYNSAIIERGEKKCAVYSSHVVPTLFMSPVTRVEGVLAKIECIFGTNIYIFCANIKAVCLPKLNAYSEQISIFSAQILKGVSAKIECIFRTNIYIFCA